MPIIGRIEVLKRSDRQRLDELSGVRGFDGEFDRGYYIKSLPEGAEHSPQISAGFLDAARIQQKLGDRGAGHWAPILFTGAGDHGPYYVTEYYPASAATIVKQRARLAPGTLHRIMRSILDGLAELRRVADREHGNLKATNVLLAGDLAKDSAEVVLTDLAPPDPGTRGPTSAVDAYHLGALLYELVTFKLPPTQWPIPNSPEWSRVGKNWRLLCNRLLNPDPIQRPNRLSQISAEVNKLRPSNTGMRAAVALGVLALAAGGAALGYQKWPAIADAFKSVAATGGPPPATGPTGVVAPATQPSSTGNPPPHNIVGTTRPATTQPTVIAVVGPQTRPAASLAGLEGVREHAAMYQQRGWEGPARYLMDLEGRLTNGTPEDLKSLLAEFNTAQGLLIRVDAQLGVIETNRKVLDGAHDKVLGTYGKFSADALKPAGQGSGAQSLEVLTRGLDGVLTDRNWAQAVAFVKGPEFDKLDREWFAETSEVQRKLKDQEGAVASAADLELWLKEASSEKYRKLDPASDPRAKWQARQRVAAIRAAELKKLAAIRPSAAGAKDEQLEAFQTRLTQIEAQATALSDQQALAWKMKNRQTIVEGVRNIDQTLTALQSEIQDVSGQREAQAAAAAKAAHEAAMRKAADQYAAQLQAVQVSAVPAIKQFWESARDSIIKEIKADPSVLRDEVKARAQRLEKLAVSLDGLYKELPDAPQFKTGAAEWNKALTAALTGESGQRRSKVLAEAVAFAQEKFSSLSEADLKAKWTQLGGPYLQWREAASSLVTDLNEADALLEAGYTLDQKPPAGATVRERLAKWQGKEPFTSQAVRSAVDALVGQIVRAGQTDPAGLFQTAADESLRLGTRLVAWKALADTDAWLKSAEDLKQAPPVTKALRRDVEKKVTDPDRRKAIESELAARAIADWTRFMVRAAKPDDVELALSLREQFGITDTSKFGPELAYDTALYDLKRALANTRERDAGREERLRKLAGTLARTSAALPAEARQRYDVPRLVAELQQFADEKPGAELTRVGPSGRKARPGESIEWICEPDSATNSVTYTARVPASIRRPTDEPLKLVFKRIEPEGAAGSFYLCTTEIPVGHFIDLVTAASRWGELSKLLWQYDPNPRLADPRPGPRIWRRNSPERAGPPIWRTTVWLAGDGQQYPPELATADNSTVLRDKDGQQAFDLNPSKDQPMQYVSPAAAMYFADLLGCRLPTPGEWVTAYRQYGPAPERDYTAEAAAKAPNGSRPNLRDKTWMMQLLWATRSTANLAYSPERGLFPAHASPGGTPQAWTEAALMGKPPAAPGSASERVYDDGALFFQEVAPRGYQQFNHLVGNVAEFTFDDRKVYVIGGSALSAPGPFEKAHEMADWRGNVKGYADVGFRLALNSPPNASDRLAGVLAKQGYAPPASAGPATQRTGGLER